MKKLIALILISTQAFAGLPSTTTKGQSDASARVKFQFQAPHNQFTNLGGIKTLIETGNGNILPDPGFEASVSGWTASGGATATTNSTAKGTGALGYDWDSNSASQTLTSTSVTIPNGYQGKNGVLSCQIKTVSGTATHTIGLWNGTTLSNTQTIVSSTTSFSGQNEGNKVSFVFPASGTVAIRLTSIAANEPEVYIDDCSIGLSDNVYDAPLITKVTDETSLFTFTGIGTPGTTKVYTNRIGDKLHVEGFVTAGTPTGTAFSINLPSKYIIDYTKVTTTTNVQKVGECSLNSSATTAYTSATSGVSHVFTDGSTTGSVFVAYQYASNAYVKNTGSSFFSSGNTLSFKFDIPISGWSAVSAVAADQTDYPDTAYTPTFTGFGTVSSSECFHSRVSDKLKVNCKFTAGTTTATEARISLPNSLTSASSTIIPTVRLAGKHNANSSSGGYFSAGTMLIEPSVTYLTMGVESSTTNGVTKANGNTVAGTGTVISFQAEIPISGWTSNQRAPTLVGSVTSNSTQAIRHESTRLTCGNSGSALIANTGTSPNWTVANGVSAGLCTVTVSFAQEPSCHCDIIGAQSILANSCLFTSTPTTTTIAIARNRAAAAENGDIMLSCDGSR